MASEYDELDDAALQEKLAAAESYEERSSIRQVIRQRKKDKGLQVGRQTKKGGGGYNRFAGSTAPVRRAPPKNFTPEEGGGAAAVSPVSPTPKSAPSGRTSQGSDRDYPPRPTTPPPVEERDPSPYQQDEDDEEYGSDDGPRPDAQPTPPAEPDDKEPDTETTKEPDTTEESQTQTTEEPEIEEAQVREEPDAEAKLTAKEAVEPEPAGGSEFTGVAGQGGDTETDFHGVQLRKSAGGSGGGSGGGGRQERGAPASSRTRAEAKFDFGVKLKTKESRAATTETAPKPEKKDDFRSRSHTYGSPQTTAASLKGSGGGGRWGAGGGGGGGPKTLRDFQQLTSKTSSSRARVKSPEEEEDEEEEGGQTMAPDDLQRYLVAYVNRELSLHPPLPVKGKSLYDTCSNSTSLCKLINKSVPNTVDLRALTRITSSTSAAERKEAEQENMMLVTESARAIGCHISDGTGDQILARNPQVIRKLLVDLIRAHVVHLPGMEDEPSSTFKSLPKLFRKLNIAVEGEAVDGGEGDGAGQSGSDQSASWRDTDRTQLMEKVAALGAEEPTPVRGSWRDKPAGEMSTEDRAAARRVERERKAREREGSGEGDLNEGLTYEERAAKRRADRERRRREREALATEL